MTSTVHPASFRDPSGFMFSRDSALLRQVNTTYRPTYEQLMNSGLYQTLVDRGYLVAHEEIEATPHVRTGAWRVLRPQPIPTVSYPYEWSFPQLKDAALLTLRIQSIAMDHGMSLKDASAYNIQFSQGKPIFIDTLSFEPIPSGKPWIAYGQFCRHFLAPLALASYVDIAMIRSLRDHIDGIPLPLASSALPYRTKWRLGLGVHVHMHARSIRNASNMQARSAKSGRTFSMDAFRGLVDNLRATIDKLRWRHGRTTWSDYYQEGVSYESESLEHKKQLVADYLSRVPSATVWDLGANTGVFSHIAAEHGADVVSWEMDPACVAANYNTAPPSSGSVLPLVLDLTNPSPAIGWAHAERDSFLDRGPVDLMMGLALIHHLAIGNNVPLPRITELFSHCADHAIVEFVPKEDSMVQVLLSTREDIFPDYSRDGFETACAPHFEILDATPIAASVRTMYLLNRT